MAKYNEVEDEVGTSFKDKVLYCIGVYGEIIGLSLIILVSIFDLIILGGRHFFEFGIGWKGVCLIWVGVILICLSKHLDRTEW